MGDLPSDVLEDKTPLEVAETPNLNFLATRGEMGYCILFAPVLFLNLMRRLFLSLATN